MILCSECYDKSGADGFDSIVPQSRCDGCDRECLGYRLSRVESVDLNKFEQYKLGSVILRHDTSLITLSIPSAGKGHAMIIEAAHDSPVPIEGIGRWRRKQRWTCPPGSVRILRSNGKRWKRAWFMEIKEYLFPRLTGKLRADS